jgi:hypothetical protein
MRDYVRQNGGAFTPEAVELLVAAFDEAWEVVRASNGVTPNNERGMRDELGRLMIALFIQGQQDRERLRDAALSHFGLSMP